MIAAILLAAANLRPAITGVGPLIATIVHDTDLSPTLAGLVTTLPLLAFGLVSPLAPHIARRLGLERALSLGLVILGVGTVLRAQGSEVALLVGMFWVGAGIAIGNVLLPSLVKRDFPGQIGVMTGAYVTVMNVFAGIGSGVSVPLASHFGLAWRGSLSIWALLAVIGLCAWIPYLKYRHQPDAPQGPGFWRSPIAWQITLFMGLQSLLFYVNVAWLPTLLHDRGFSLALSGWIVSLVQIVSLPATFLMPVLAERQRRQHSLVIATATMFIVGYLGLWLMTSPLWSVIWVICVGFGSGVSISLALAFFSLRTHRHESAARISGMAQSIGYLLAALGPITAGYLYAITHSWAWPLAMLIVVSLFMTAAGLGASRDVYLDAP